MNISEERITYFICITNLLMIFMFLFSDDKESAVEVGKMQKINEKSQSFKYRIYCNFYFVYSKKK